MSIHSFNSGLDDGYCGKFPDEKRMLNDRDYFEGYCMAEDIEEKYEKGDIMYYKLAIEVNKQKGGEKK